MDDEDLAGALNDMDIKSNGREEVKGNQRRSDKIQPLRDNARRSYERTDNLARASDVPSDNYMPIKALNQFSTDWVIKARVVKKGDVRSWSNARGNGTLFTIDLIDREGTLIQATSFNETATKMADMLEAERVYTFAGG